MLTNTYSIQAHIKDVRKVVNVPTNPIPICLLSLIIATSENPRTGESSDIALQTNEAYQTVTAAQNSNRATSEPVVYEIVDFRTELPPRRYLREETKP